MTNADKIRSLNDDDMATFLFHWTCSNLAAFLERGGAGCMDCLQLREWLESEAAQDD